MWRLVWIILTLPLALCSFKEQVIIISRYGIDTEQCLGGLKHCQSLGFAARHANRSVHFQVDGELPLQELVTFHSTANITIAGSNHSELICSPYCNKCGLEFSDTQSVILQNITITGCAIVQNLSVQGIPYQSAVILRNCRDIVLTHVTVQSSQGYGVVLINSSGDVEVSRSYFVNNTIPCSNCNTRGGAGMLILVSSCDIIFTSTCNETHQISARYLIMNSVFSGNYLGNFSYRMLQHPWALYYGVGLGVLLWWGAYGNNISIINSNFSGNSGPCGGGLSIVIDFNSTNNFIVVFGSSFTHNTELQNALGGAGAAVGIVSDDYHHFPLRNTVSFTGCHFSYNEAFLGAGTSVYATGAKNSETAESNNLQFSDCTWEHNSGVSSPAIDIKPDFYSTLRTMFILKTSFTNCKLLNNTINSHLSQQRHSYDIHSAPGVLLVSHLNTYFFGETVFQNNKGTAFVLFSASAEFGDGSVTTFTNNTGVKGGALVLFEFASLRYKNNTQFNFTNNTASIVGGAIYVFRHTEHRQYSSRACFIGYVEYVKLALLDPENLNVHFYFRDNRAGSGFANSMFVSTVEPCRYSCERYIKGDKPSPLETFNQSCLGHFHFFDNIPDQIGTDGSHFTLTEPPLFQIIPGREYHVPVDITDEFGNNALPVTVFQPFVKSEDAHVDPAFLLVTNNTVVLEGNPGSQGSLTLVSARSGDGIDVPFHLAPCAPGYVSQNGSNGFGKCVCSTINNKNRYQGVIGCDDSIGVALVAPGTWVGYVSGSRANEDNLFTGYCVHGYCADVRIFVNNPKQYKLLPNASREELEHVVCSANRQGILCGKCTANHSVYYHSSSFVCGPDTLCKLGPFFYLLSELLPTAILFMVIIFFDISLTSGYAYSIIFMLQMMQVTLKVTLVSGTQYQDLSFIQIALMIYSSLNLDFFSLEQLSFCLWAGAGALDMLVMKYVTVLFAVVLVVCTVLLINYCNCGRLSRCFHCRNRQRSFVQGLTAILVICYSQCTLVAFYSLIAANITGKGGREYSNRVVYFDGNIPYFSAHHLPYAIPALFVLVTIVIPLPVILFCDPFFLKLEYQINHCCGSSRNRYPWTMFRQKFKPLFDSFQGCFKDELRFASGLFFIYRIIIILALVLSPGLDWFYGSMMVILILILGIQAMMQPFQASKHNIVTVLVFLNLAMVNCLSIIIYMLVYGSVHTNPVYILEWVQLVVVYLPIVCCICWCLWKGCKWLGSKKRRWGYNKELDEDVTGTMLQIDIDNRLPE